MWFNDGHGTFSPRPQILNGLSPYDMALADLDGDSDLDLVLAMTSPPHQIFFNTTVDAVAKLALDKIRRSRWVSYCRWLFRDREWLLRESFG